jgi:hypothetical protein
MTSEKAVERSIDSLQRIYAVIVALSIGEAVRRMFLKAGSADVEFHTEHLPEFIAFLITSVPFLHGMNRHMDKTLSESRKKNDRRLLFFLVVDFWVFLAESCLLFLMAEKVTAGVDFFQVLLWLLVLDIVWTVSTYPITRSILVSWLAVNISTAALVCVVLYLLHFGDLVKSWVLAVAAVLRTVLDYWFAWSFYFPEEE